MLNNQPMMLRSKFQLDEYVVNAVANAGQKPLKCHYFDKILICMGSYTHSSLLIRLNFACNNTRVVCAFVPNSSFIGVLSPAEKAQFRPKLTII